MAFRHLHVHTEYSLLDGSSKIKELVARTKELGMDSIAITDHGVMYGVIDFYKAAKKAGIKPIVGCEVYVAPGSRFDREAGRSDERYNHLVLLAENNTGYANLIKIVSKGFVEGFYYKPRVDYEVLREYHEGIIALSACLAGVVASYLAKGFYEEAKSAALELRDIFGDNNFFLEMQDHGIPEQKHVNQGLLRMHEETGIPLVVTNDSHYIYEDDAKAHDILLCIQTQKKVQDTDRMRYEGGQYYVKSEREMRELFPYAQEAIDNTGKIAERCNVEIEFGHYKLPKYDVPDGRSAGEYLYGLCIDGLTRRYGADAHLHRERLDHELNIIRKMGFVDYFLIVWDFIKYAKDNGIPVGPGRGSAAGSIVAYSLGITDIDPIKYNLLFERFLNPERVSMPDIDVDFCYERRQEVIDYVVRKYGKDRVVQIVTFGTMKAKNAIRDVGRALDLSYGYVDTIAKMIPNELGITIQSALEKNPELRAAYSSDDGCKYLIDMSMRLEGLPRHTSIHAAGVVISNAPAIEYVPLSKSADDVITTQYTMTTLEELGLLKMDFLGLRTLTVIQDAVDLVNYGSEQGFTHLKGNKDKFSISDIEYDDPKVFELIGSGHCEGIFQLESPGMKSFMRELKPKNLEDVIAGISLYRPGPMDYIPKYLEGKNNRESIEYDCPELEHILEPTYGCMVYQEQVMQIVRDLAGYSYGRSDLVRRAMSKKKYDVMEKERVNFVYGNLDEGVAGCAGNNISENAAMTIFDRMTEFAKYAFNKSHAAAYAVVAYQTAYLKCYYPVEFMASLITSVIDRTDKVAAYIISCRQMGIDVLPPSINEGFGSFSTCEKGIRYGLSAIKGVGKPVIDTIVEERKNGLYTDLEDFVKRVSGKDVNKRAIENFIKAGAMDDLPGNRRQKMQMYTRLVDDINNERKHNVAGQMSLFEFEDGKGASVGAAVMPDVPEYDKGELLAYEKDVLGIYVSGHPMEEYVDLWKNNITRTADEFAPDEDGDEAGGVNPLSGLGNISGDLIKGKIRDNEPVIIGGIVAGKVVKTTRKNEIMAFVTVEDIYGSVEVIVFPGDYERYKTKLNDDNKIFIKGHISLEEDRPSKVVCEKIVAFDEVPSELWLQFADKEDYTAKELSVNTIIAESDGDDEVVIYLAAERAMKRLPKSRTVSVADTKLISELSNILGTQNIRVLRKSKGIF